MVTDTLAPMGAASFFLKKKPLDCARGDKKRYSEQRETASHFDKLSVTLYFISLHHANRHHYHITRTDAKPF